MHRLTFEDTMHIATHPEIINVDSPSLPDHTPMGTPNKALTNTSALDVAYEKIEAFVRTLRYPQQRAVFKDNAMRYITTFADFYRESKSILKTKDDPKYCPPSCRISIPLQPTQRVKESTAFKTLADESARIANNISLQMAAQVLKCKYLNNADKQRESVEIYAKGLANMAEIIIAEINTDSMTKHDLVTDFLSFYEHEALSHLTITIDKFIEIYRTTNKLKTPLCLHQTLQSPNPHQPHANDASNTANMTPQPRTPTANSTCPTEQPRVATLNHNNTTTMTIHHHNDFVTALSLLNTPNPPATTNQTVLHTTSPPVLNNTTTPTSLQSPTNNLTPYLLNAESIAENFEQASAYHTTSPPIDSPNNSTTNFIYTIPQPPPAHTMINPYKRRTTTVNTSHDYTSNELTASLQAQEALQNANLNSTRNNTANHIHNTTIPHNANIQNHTTPNTTPNPPRPTTFIHTTPHNGESDSTITNTHDGTPHSSRSTTSTHPNTTTGTRATALRTIRMAVLSCYAGAQAEYIRAYNAKTIEANLSKIAARQRTEECAEATAITIHTEDTPTPRTVGAAIDARIRKTQTELEKRLQSLEQRLANEKHKSASLERRLTKQPPPPASITNSQQAKDEGARTVGAYTKKSTTTALTTNTHTPTQRWVPPPPQAATQHKKRNLNPAVYDNATPPSTTERGYYPYAARARQKQRPTPTRFSGTKRWST